MENVANYDVKALHEIHRTTSLIEVYKGVISAPLNTTQFDLKRRPAPYKDDCVHSRPWSDVKEMETWLKRYVKNFPYKARSLQQLEMYISDVEARRKAERRRKRRLEDGYRRLLTPRR
jgi:hypothetical protein